MPKRLIVVGGGAAGFFCAITAARLLPELEVLLLEKTGAMLSKVRVSGGGRCNVTHACFAIDDMIRRYPRGAHFLKKAFSHFFIADTVEWFKERGVTLKEEPDGRMFPVTDNSQTIIDCLVKESNRYAVRFYLKHEVCKIEPGKSGVGFHITTREGAGLETDYLCVACGGYPKTFLFDWLLSTGHHIVDPVPSLFTFNVPRNPINELMGISVPDAQVRIPGTKLQERGALLITHWGFSGPAILRLSAWGARYLAKPIHEGSAPYHFFIKINWLPEFTELRLRQRFQELRQERGAQPVANRNPFNLPQRLWQYLLQQSAITEKLRWAELTSPMQQSLVMNLNAQVFEVKGKTTFKEEFVTAGGIQLSETDPHTMESRLCPGLYFAGEILDIDGLTGGFNFQNAWTTGFIAGSSIALKAASPADRIHTFL